MKLINNGKGFERYLLNEKLDENKSDIELKSIGFNLFKKNFTKGILGDFWEYQNQEYTEENLIYKEEQMFLTFTTVDYWRTYKKKNIQVSSVLCDCLEKAQSKTPVELGFNLIENHPNQVGPNKRPFHTIIPAFVTKKGKPIMSFGIMGGQMQPQGHTQMIIRIFDYNQNPQAALDAPRWRLMQGLKVNLEDGFKKEISNELPKLGHQINKDHYFNFGGGQIIYQLEEGYLVASDPRKDGQAIGY